jgi:hypothetical protein
MGNLFKPSTTVVQAPQQMSTSYEIPAYFKEAQEAAISRALASTIGTPTFDDQGKMTSMGTPVAYQAYTGQRIAPLSGYEQQAANVLSQQILPQAGQLGAIGAQTFDAATAAQYANPYQDQVISGTLSDLREQYGMTQRALGARAIGAGAFGGAREGVERALGTERFLDTVGDTSSRLRQAGFESGAQRFASDRAAQLGASQAQLQGLAGAVTGLGGAGATEKRNTTSRTC